MHVLIGINTPLYLSAYLCHLQITGWNPLVIMYCSIITLEAWRQLLKFQLSPPKTCFSLLQPHSSGQLKSDGQQPTRRHLPSRAILVKSQVYSHLYYEIKMQTQLWHLQGVIEHINTKQLNTNKNILILPADKGNAIVSHGDWGLKRERFNN